MEHKETKDGSKVCYAHGGDGCGCCCCGHGGGWGRFSILRVVLGVVLLIFVFWFGVKVGEVKILFNDMSMQRGMMMYHDMGAGMGGTPTPGNGY